VHVQVLVLFVAAVIGISAPLLGAGRGYPQVTRTWRAQMNNTTQQAKEELNRFDQQKDLDALVKAAEIIDRIGPERNLDLEQRAVAKRVKLELWLSLLNAIDKKIDPKFDPKDVPALSVAPPAVEGQVTFAGMDPKGIKDPAARREYEEAIERNSEKTKQYTFQRRLARLNAELSERAEAYIKAGYPKSPKSSSEIDGAVSKYISNSRRAAALRALVSQ